MSAVENLIAPAGSDPDLAAPARIGLEVMRPVGAVSSFEDTHVGAVVLKKERLRYSCVPGLGLL